MDNKHDYTIIELCDQCAREFGGLALIEGSERDDGYCDGGGSAGPIPTKLYRIMTSGLKFIYE